MNRPDRISQILRKFELSAQRWFDRANLPLDEARPAGASRSRAEPATDEVEGETSNHRLEIDLNEGIETHEASGEVVVLDWDDIEFIDGDEPRTSDPSALARAPRRVTARLRHGTRLAQQLGEYADEAARDSSPASDFRARASAGVIGRGR